VHPKRNNKEKFDSHTVQSFRQQVLHLPAQIAAMANDKKRAILRALPMAASGVFE
jgi:hypothetical protein